MKQNIAVITGASSGLGKEFVRLLYKRKKIDTIWAIARNQGKLEKLKDEFDDKIKIFSLDLSDTKKILRFQEVLKKEKPNIRYLINSAGFGKFCSYQDMSIENSVNMIDLNCSGIVSMGLVCIPYMSKHSHIINIASQASFQPLPYLNIYSSTKAFVRYYSRALNVELKDKGISVTAVCPGWIKTEFFKRAKIGADKAINNFSGIVIPKLVAKKALNDANKGKDMSVYSLYIKLNHIVAKILPQKVMMKIWLKQQGL